LSKRTSTFSDDNSKDSGVLRIEAINEIMSKYNYIIDNLGFFMVDNLIDSFQQAFRNLQLQPLVTPEEIRKFRVEYNEILLEQLEQAVLDCNHYSNQLIFAGHRGCGKSTLLKEFTTFIDNSLYFTVFFSISDLIEMSDINHINILFAIAVQLMAKA
jgi:hypothetical protein